MEDLQIGDLASAIKATLHATRGEGGVSIHLRRGTLATTARTPHSMALYEAGYADYSNDVRLHFSKEDARRASRVLAHPPASLRWEDRQAVFGVGRSEVYASFTPADFDAPELLAIPESVPTFIPDGWLLHAVLAALPAKQAADIRLLAHDGRFQVEIGDKLAADLPCSGPPIVARLDARLLRPWTGTLPREGAIEMWYLDGRATYLFRCAQAGSVFALAPLL